MNELDDKTLSKSSFAFRDITGQDRWLAFTPVFTSLTVVGTATYVGRFRSVGRQCFFQVTLLASTSIASTAGTTYMDLPVTATGIAGQGHMSNITTKLNVGPGHLDASTSRYYLANQTATGNTIAIAGWYEI